MRWVGFSLCGTPKTFCLKHGMGLEKAEMPPVWLRFFFWSNPSMIAQDYALCRTFFIWGLSHYWPVIPIGLLLWAMTNASSFIQEKNWPKKERKICLLTKKMEKFEFIYILWKIKKDKNKKINTSYLKIPRGINKNIYYVGWYLKIQYKTRSKSSKPKHIT